MSENKINDGDLFEDYLSQSINWFTNALRLENDDSFADLQIKCLQSYLSTCFDNLNTNNGMPTTSILNGHRKLMIAINDIYASYQEELKKNIGGEESRVQKTITDVPLLLGLLEKTGKYQKNVLHERWCEIRYRRSKRCCIALANHEGGIIKSQIMLLPDVKVELIPASSSSHKSSFKARYLFQICTKSKNIILATKSEERRRYCMQCIQKEIEKVQQLHANTKYNLKKLHVTEMHDDKIKSKTISKDELQNEGKTKADGFLLNFLWTLSIKSDDEAFAAKTMILFNYFNVYHHGIISCFGRNDQEAITNNVTSEWNLLLYSPKSVEILFQDPFVIHTLQEFVHGFAVKAELRYFYPPGGHADIQIYEPKILKPIFAKCSSSFIQMTDNLPCPSYSPFVTRFIFRFSTLKKLGNVKFYVPIPTRKIANLSNTSLTCVYICYVPPVNCVSYEKLMQGFLNEYKPFVILYNPQRSSQKLLSIWTIIFADAMPFREIFGKPDVLNLLNNCERQSENVTCEIYGDVLCEKCLNNISSLQVMGIKVEYVTTLPSSFALNDSPIYYFEDHNTTWTCMMKLGSTVKNWKNRWL